jgi:hypothetical protein
MNKPPVRFVMAVIVTAAVLTLDRGQAHAQEDCAPSVPVDAIQLYEGINYQGACIQLRKTVSPHTGYWGLWLFGWNDRAGSIRVGSDVRVKLFRDGGFTGERNYVYSDDPTLAPAYWASSLRIEERAIDEHCQDLLDGEVAFYTDADFQGDCWVWNAASSGGQLVNVGITGIANDSISSVRNHSPHTLRLWHDLGVTGGHGDDWTPYTEGNVTAFSNDEITSVVVAH